MRILAVRFKNLNSLVGEWEIDLTHPSFLADGIFAITGPTGAGKSTILDAICLGLYGTTPRLSKVTKSGNEIMSRHTGECFAEVTFETQAGRFRCHWSQHRARKRSDGELQNPRHEIVDAATDRVIESKIKGVAGRIEQTTGMDFDRFTRSMLLAQGGFAAFLQADADSRAPILEQITGTEIYSRISIRVHERYGEERTKLETMKSELTGMQLLNAEDVQRLNEELAKNTTREKELERALQQMNAAIVWLNGIDGLEKELVTIEEQRLALDARREAFQPDSHRLARALKALELSAEHSSLDSLRRTQDSEQQRLATDHQLIPTRRKAVEHADQTLKAASAELERLRTLRNEETEILRRVRELDLTIREKDKPIKTALTTIESVERERNTLKNRHEKDSTLFEQHKKKLESIERYLEDNQHDKGLIEHLTALTDKFKRYRDVGRAVNGILEALNLAEKQKTKAEKSRDKLNKSVQKRISEREATREIYARLQDKLSETLAGHSLSDLRDSLANLKERKPLLETTLNLLEWIDVVTQKQHDGKARLATLDNEMATVSASITSRTAECVALEQNVLLLEERVTLLNHIKNYDDARKHFLKDGEPCPLCGASDHPFARGNVPLPDEATAALAQGRKDSAAATKILTKLTVRKAEINKELEQSSQHQVELTADLKSSTTRLSEGLHSLNVALPEENPAQMVQDLLSETRRELTATASLITSAEKLEKELQNSREALEKAREESSTAEKDLQTATHLCETATREFERLGRESQTQKEQLQSMQGDIMDTLKPYGISTLSVETIDRVREELIQRRDRWLEHQKQKTEFDAKISTLELQLQHQHEQISNDERALKEQRDGLALLIREQDDLRGTRRELYGEKNPDEEEKRLTKAVELTEKNCDQRREELTTARQMEMTLKTRIEDSETSVKTRSDQIREAAGLLHSRLTAVGFNDENDFLKARLSEQERRELTALADRLKAEESDLKTRHTDRITRLRDERKKEVTDESREKLSNDVETLTLSFRELQQQTGGIQQQLRENENLQLKQKDRIAEITVQTKEYSRWGTLHDLIGSANGKKFRNFAQGLTFELMIDQANRQLQKMTDRYLLIRDEESPLDLNVIDNYQAGEIRSTKNLSGGESFIVSLCLALGLSQMASRNVRVDSLFLDEGFGSLDEDALDTALETLAGLHQDGKLIGVISHVPALKERIATQILITPLSGGKSSISGPGCESLD